MCSNNIINNRRKDDTVKVVVILFIAFIVLKIIGIVNISWWIVLAPIWIPVVIDAVWVGGCRLLDWIFRS
ncbi:MAG: hypothetical protein IJ272_00720 [Clostridia bacterium]|nr:hypothetical protein [Clostridia bacterium]